MRITLDKWEDEGQGLGQRVSSPPTNGFLSWITERWYSLQHCGIQGIARWITPKFSDDRKQKIISNGTYICWKQFFSQRFLAPFFKLFNLFQNYHPMQSQGQSLKFPGGLQTAHCFSPTVMHQLPHPWMSWSSERWPLQQGMGPHPGASLVILCQQFNISSILSSMEHWTYIQALC